MYYLVLGPLHNKAFRRLLEVQVPTISGIPPSTASAWLPGQDKVLFTLRRTSPHGIQVAHTQSIPSLLQVVLVCPRGDLSELGIPPEKSSGVPRGVPSSAGPEAGQRWFHLGCQIDVRNRTSQLAKSYKAGMFITAPGARGIAPPNLHTEESTKQTFITPKPTYSLSFTVEGGESQEWAEIIQLVPGIH